MSNSSISNSERKWKRSELAGLAAAALTSLLFLCAITAIDPYDLFSFSPSFDRQPLASQRGLSVANLARKPEFDSAIVGSSTVQILNPTDMDTIFGGRFVNLSIWAGTAWEQKLAAQLFARHHPTPRSIIMSMDFYWCYGVIPARRPPDQFQDWMYHETSVLDVLHLFHMATLWDSMEQLDYIRHIRNSATGANGYQNIFPDSLGNIDQVRQRIYGTSEAKPIPLLNEEEIAKLTKNHNYPNHIYLPQILDAVPASTTKILFFIPIHMYGLNSSGADTVAMFTGCKSSIIEIAKRYQNIIVLDFLIDSPLTRDDKSFWDPWHYEAKTGKLMMELAAKARQQAIENENSVRLLYRG